MTVEPYIALTDKQWFDFLSSRATPAGDVRLVDEANFWFPNAQRPPVKLQPGQPVFLRLKSPFYAIAGVGFHSAFHRLHMQDAWQVFDWRNGDATYHAFHHRIRAYRMKAEREAGSDASDESFMEKPLGCLVLRAVELWPQERWVRWGEEMGFHKAIQQGATERDPQRAALLMSLIGPSATVWDSEFGERFQLVTADGRAWRERLSQVAREGQGSFRLRLLQAYGSQCAITGEHTEPVLDAAHIQPYLGPASNHVQNGLLLAKEFHTLFDRGYVTVTPDHLIKVSSRLKRDFANGRRYYPYDGQPLAKLPDAVSARPSADALEWHGRHVFLAG